MQVKVLDIQFFVDFLFPSVLKDVFLKTSQISQGDIWIKASVLVQLQASARKFI